MKKIAILGCCLLVSCAPASALAVDIVDQKDPNYLQSVDRLEESRQAMAKAMDLVRDSMRIHRIPSFDYQRLLSDLSAISTQLDAVLSPERHRQKSQVLYPDSIYFVPMEIKK